MRKLAKVLLGLGTFTPILSSVGLGAYIAIRLILADIASGGTSPDLLRVLSNSPFEVEDLIVFSVILGVVVIVQLVAAVACSIHAASDPRLGSTGKALWIVGIFLIGIFVLPLYFVLFVWRDPPPKRESALDRPPIAP